MFDFSLKAIAHNKRYDILSVANSFFCDSLYVYKYNTLYNSCIDSVVVEFFGISFRRSRTDSTAAETRGLASHSSEL